MLIANYILTSPPCLADITAINKGVIPYIIHGQRYFFPRCEGKEKRKEKISEK